MTTDLWMLVATAMLGLLMILIYGTGRYLQPGGIAWASGNRATELPVPPWVARAVKAHANLIENLAPFAVLVLVAHVSGKANAATALGATIFFWARVAHLGAYVAGIVFLRTLVWMISWMGGVIILMQLFK